jgi:HEAT repeat protein
MKRSLLVTISMSLVLGACATAPPPAAVEPNMDESRWSGDPRLYRMLLPYPITAAERDSLAAYAQEHEAATNYLLAEAAEDEHAPVVVRVNALFALAERGASGHLHVFRNALVAEDVRIRATAAAAMRRFVDSHPREAGRIARAALSDTAAEVQAQALQVLGDVDVDLLRDYLPEAANAELRTVARGLVQLAEQRGAPLIGDSATGVLRRVTSDGFSITFQPERHWPKWDAGFGTVRIEKDGTTLQTIQRVESVGGVIPVFLSPDARHVVFERDRTIVVRTMADGTERVVGPGIAPRPRPFTDEFVFAREQPGSAVQERSETTLGYDILTAPFDPPGEIEPTPIGSTTATMSFGDRGGYSPVRWMRVEERAASFYLTAMDMQVVSLPDPFG